MTPRYRLALASFLAVAALAGDVLAQQPTAPRPGGSAPQSTPPGPGYAPPGPLSPTVSMGPPSPVLMVTSVEVLRSSRSGGMDIVRVRGLTTSTAWSNPHLIPITRGDPVDGVLDLLFEANAPGGPYEIGPFMPIEALLPIETGHPYKGIRVRAATNALGLKELPGFAEVPAPKNDCAKCLGKYFVAKGANPPAGAAPENVVREADLPWTLRIIRPTDGIASYVSDPNRLTLVLSEDGRIVDAGWD